MNQPELMEIAHTFRHEVWSCGGGTQSCAIAALIIQGRLPKPHFAVMADTGFEKQATWDYFDGVLRPELAKVGVQLHRVLRSEWAYPSENSIYTTRGGLLIPAFSNESGQTGKLTNFCSTGWKVHVVCRWLAAQGVRAFRSWLGLSAEEQRRWAKKITDPAIYLPLVHLKLDRAACIRLVEEMGWPTPPRSNCWMCPNQTDAEWRELSESEMAKAIEFEKRMQEVDPSAWLHRSCVPIHEVSFAEGREESRACDSGVCFS